MKKIFNFSDFSHLFEADGETTEAKIYQQNLKIVVNDLLSLYYDTTEYPFPEGTYTDAEIDADFEALKAEKSLEGKARVFGQIMEKVKQKALSTNKIKGAKELIEALGNTFDKYLEALTYITDKYKGSKEEADSMLSFIDKEIQAFQNFINDVNEGDFNSEFFGHSQIFEGKKSLLSDAETSINSLRGKIDSYKMDPDARKKKFATDADLEIIKIANKVKNIRGKKNRDIEKSEIASIFTELTELETKFDSGINKIIDDATADTELERLRNKARDVKDLIQPLRNEYLKNKNAIKDEEKISKIKVKLEKDLIDYVPEDANKPNQEAKKFQDLVTDTFKNVKPVTELPFYKKMGTSGKFGPNTRDMVKFLKAGFGLKDRSGDITKELMDEIQIQRETIKEGFSSSIFTFANFVNISEAAWDFTKAMEVAKTLPTYAPAKSGQQKEETKGDEKSPYGWKPSEKKSTEETPKAETTLTKEDGKRIIEAANKIIAASKVIGTREKDLLTGLRLIRSRKEFDELNRILGETHGKGLTLARKKGLKTDPEKGHSSFQEIVNSEMDGGNLTEIKEIQNHLKSIKINSAYSTIKDKYGSDLYKKNSFKIK